MRTTSKKLIGFIAAAAMTVSLLPANIAFAEDYGTWTDAANAAVQNTDYTYDSDTYTVYTAKGLAYTAALVNGTVSNKEKQESGISKYPNINITLANDIDLSTAGVTGYDVGTVTDTNSWIPIGDSGNKYTGTFDGAENTISNLYVYSSTLSYSGLFGYIDSTGSVESTTVKSGAIKINKTGGIASYAGGIAGDNYGTITNCTNHCEIINDSGSSAYAGGIAGENHGKITSSSNYGSVTGNTAAGGIAGTNNPGIIQDCGNSGEIKGKTSGGIAGYNNSPSKGSAAVIDGCLNSGNVVGISGEEVYVGGITGQSSGNNSVTVIVKNCVNTGSVGVSGNYVGGIVSSGANTDIINCANAGTLNGGNGGIICMLSGGKIINCVNTGESTCGIANGLLSGTVSNSYYLKGSASKDIGSNYGTVTDCGAFSLGSDGKYVIDNGDGDLIETLNAYAKENGYSEWAYSENGGLQLGDYTVIEPTEPEQPKVTTSAVAVAEDSEAETALENEGINTAEGRYGGEAYGNTISTTFRTTQAIADANSTYGVWTVDLTQGGAYVKTQDGTGMGTGTAIVTDGENVKNNKGAIYAMDSSNAGKYKLYFNKNTYLSGSGGVVFGLVIDGLYAPDAVGTFEFTNNMPTGVELTESNSIFTGDGEDYKHNDSVLHPAA